MSTTELTKSAKIVKTIQDNYNPGDKFTNNDVAKLTGFHRALINSFLRKNTNSNAVAVCKIMKNQNVFMLIDKDSFVYSPYISKDNFSGRNRQYVDEAKTAVAEVFERVDGKIKVSTKTPENLIDDLMNSVTLVDIIGKLSALKLLVNTPKRIDLTQISDAEFSAEVSRRLNEKR